jgi:hypothetical protein
LVDEVDVGELVEMSAFAGDDESGRDAGPALGDGDVLPRAVTVDPLG